MIRFRSLNCNCGPDSSEWYAVEHRHVARLRKIVKTEHDVDIYLNEGLWFPTREFLEKFQIPYKYGTSIVVVIIIFKFVKYILNS